jgi:hypothetical protein
MSIGWEQGAGSKEIGAKTKGKMEVKQYLSPLKRVGT